MARFAGRQRRLNLSRPRLVRVAEPEGRGGRGLRSQISSAIAAVAVLSVVAFGVPLAVLAGRLIQSRALTTLQRDATRAVAVVPDNVIEAGTPVAVPHVPGGSTVGVYDVHGQRVGGAGPARSGLAAAATAGTEQHGHEAGALTVVVPVRSDTRVAGSVRASTPLSALYADVLAAWGLLAALAAVVAGLATVQARRSARRISTPFEQLTVAARGLGEGRYDVRLPRWSIAEADAAAEALAESGAAIQELLQHERDFVRHASHQLRTPLSALLVHLGQSPADVEAATVDAHHLQRTIDDLLALRALSRDEACDPVDVARTAALRWSTADRAVVLRAQPLDDVALPAAALRQSLDVLLDNAMRHGAGQVTVTVEPFGDTVMVEVADRGAGFSRGSRHGTGLELVSGVMERGGGSLLVRHAGAHPRVALILPTAHAREVTSAAAGGDDADDDDTRQGEDQRGPVS